MVKVRLHGMPEEVGKFKKYLETLSPKVQLLSVSENYPDRGQSKYVRAYLDVELRSAATINEEFDKLFNEVK